MHARNHLALIALLSLSIAGCHSPDSGAGIKLKTGNMIVTVAPKKISGPQLLITYGSGGEEIFGAYLDATGEGFEIRSKDGWYPLEKVTEIKVEDQGAGDVIVLLDSTGALVELESTITDLDSEFIANAATGDWYELDTATGFHKFAVYILFKDAIHVIDVRAKG